VYAYWVLVTKLKPAATDKAPRKSYGNICDFFTTSEKILVGGGPEFDNKELREEHTKQRTKLEICPSCSPASLRIRMESFWITSSACGLGTLEKTNNARWIFRKTGQTTWRLESATSMIDFSRI
jgi:hypothetical protein